MKKITLMLTVIALAACSGVNVKKENAKSQKKITNSVSFRLDCQAGEAELKCLNTNEYTDACDEYGVVACGEKSIYSKVGSSWIMTASKKL